MSGDIGLVVIYGFRGKKDVLVFMFYFKGCVSFVQEQQMIMVLDVNVYNLVVIGNFDNCQVSCDVFLFIV